MRYTLLLLLLAAPAQAQTIGWSWSILSVPTIGDPAKVPMQISIDYADWQPLTGVTCGPEIPDVGSALDCEAELQLTSGPHDIILRAVLPAGGFGLPFRMVAPSRLSLPQPGPCPYTPPNGVPGTRPVGYALEGVVSFPRLETRIPELQRDGWFITPKIPTATALPIRAVCRGGG